MDNQSLQPVSIIEPRHSSPFYVPPEQEKHRVHITPFILAFGGLVIFGMTGLLAYLAVQEQAQNANNPQIIDAGAQEVLNAELAEEVRKSPYLNYAPLETVLGYPSASPEQVCQDFGLACADFANPENIPAAKKVDPINSNGLNYYLEQGKIVVISATGGTPFSATGKAIVVYAGYPENANYRVFDPSEQVLNAYYILSRAELYNHITGVPNFYILEKDDV